jgi:phage major head subunit gpT-like protein
VDGLTLEAARHPGELIYSQLAANPLAFDGVALFADTRVIGRSANVDNSLAGTGVTVAALQTDLAAAVAAMSLFQDDKGRPMGLIGDTLIVPSALKQPFYQALNANQGNINQPVAPPGTNYEAGGYQVILNPYATDANDWFLVAANGGPIKPFIFQDRIKPAMEGITNPETESGIIRDRFLYTVRARYNVGVSDPRYFVRTVN